MGQFDTNAVALETRIDAHERYGSRDLNAWLFSLLDVQPGQTILDLGCGTGKQTIPLAEMVGPVGHIYGIDISVEALTTLNEQLTELFLTQRVDLLEDGLDDFKLASWPNPDRALAAFSLYYAHDPGKVMKTVRDALKPGGVFVFCGPGEGNNAEIKRLLQYSPSDAAIDFMEHGGPKLASQIFKETALMRFENPLTFPSVEALMAYWRAGNLYDEHLEKHFQSVAERHFEEYYGFITTKRVLAIRGAMP